MQTILVPLDTSALAAQIMPYVSTLAVVLKARVHLLHIWDIEENMFYARHEDVKTQLIAQTATLRRKGIDASCNVLPGVPADCIVDTARKMEVSMIAMATHGYSGVQRWTLGSTTDKVVQATDIPVFVVRSHPEAAPEQFALRRILVPLDRSDFSRQALDCALKLATAAQADLHLLHVMEPISEVYSPEERKRIFVDRRRIAMGEMATLADQELFVMSDEIRAGALTVSWHVASGHPATKIIDEAIYQQSDLIVMATHGYGGMQRWAMGSTADKVLHATTTPLALVHVR
jgi:nucleotide-binding universal stress UspA family protein